MVSRIKAEQPGFRAKLEAQKTRQAAASAAKAGPTLKEQAASHRETKGSRDNRLRNISNTLNMRAHNTDRMVVASRVKRAKDEVARLTKIHGKNSPEVHLASAQARIATRQADRARAKSAKAKEFFNRNIAGKPFTTTKAKANAAIQKSNQEISSIRSEIGRLKAEHGARSQARADSLKQLETQQTAAKQKVASLKAQLKKRQSS